MSTYKCESCGAQIKFEPGASVAVCEYCGTVQSLGENSQGGANLETLLQRVKIFLDNRDFDSAEEYCERALDIAPVSGVANYYKLLADLRVEKLSEFSNRTTPIDGLDSYKNLLRFGSENQIAEAKNLTEHICLNIQKSKLENDLRITELSIEEHEKEKKRVKFPNVFAVAVAFVMSLISFVLCLLYPVFNSRIENFESARNLALIYIVILVPLELISFFMLRKNLVSPFFKSGHVFGGIILQFISLGCMGMVAGFAGFFTSAKKIKELQTYIKKIDSAIESCKQEKITLAAQLRDVTETIKRKQQVK